MHGIGRLVEPSASAVISYTLEKPCAKQRGRCHQADRANGSEDRIACQGESAQAHAPLELAIGIVDGRADYVDGAVRIVTDHGVGSMDPNRGSASSSQIAIGFAHHDPMTVHEYQTIESVAVFVAGLDELEAVEGEPGLEFVRDFLVAARKLAGIP